MLTRRSLIKGITAGTACAAQKGQPNLLFLIADDHAGYVMGCDGNRRAETPHLDQLAAEGVRFASHYCNSPICTPSRQSLFTGQMPYASGVTLLKTALAEDKPTIAGQLQKSGYRTGVFGKMHFNRPGRPGLFGIDTCMTEDVIDREWNRQKPARDLPEHLRTKPSWRPFKDPARIWLNADKLPYPRFDEDMKGTFITHRTEQYLEDRKRDGRPFALWASFMEPHSPYDFPIEDRDHFTPSQFAPPSLGPQDLPNLPEVFKDLSIDDKRGIIAAYYTSVRFLDRNIGRVLKKLADLGLDRNTLVVYTADHGYFLGQHGRFEKHYGFDPALRVPLIVRWPGRIRPAVVHSLSEHVDISSTILDMLQADPLPVQHGETLRPYLEGRGMADPRSHVFGVYLETEQAYVRTEHYKFIYSSGRQQDWYHPSQPIPGSWRRLYDLKKDPGELHDVAAEHPDLVRQFETVMLERFRKTHPDASSEPRRLSSEAALDFYLRPRDA